MTHAQCSLLEKINQFKIGGDEEALSFQARLSRENAWDHSFAAICIREYKRFLYLAATSEFQVTPSDQVDQVWHLHLTYTHSYWVELCEGILARPLHHVPTVGGRVEADTFYRQYQLTLDKYREVFNEAPPQAVWPNPRARFENADKFTRLNQTRYWLIKKPSAAFTSLVAMPLLLAACTQVEGEEIWFYIKWGVALYALYKVFSWLGGAGGGKGGGSGGSSAGCGGCGD